MEEGLFNENDLILNSWQYTICHKNVTKFSCGEKVFLKSNIEHPMIVHSVNKNTITTIWCNNLNEMQIHEFPPECILQYKYACLLTFRRNINICLN